MNYLGSNELDGEDDAPQDDYVESVDDASNDDGNEMSDGLNNHYGNEDDDDENVKDDLMYEPVGFEDDDYADDDNVDREIDSFENELLQNNNNLVIPENQVLDAKPVTKSLRTGGIMTNKPFGTGELFDDESSAAALIALLGLLLVIIVLSFLYLSFRQAMGVAPTTKKGSSMQDTYKVDSLPLVKRRE
jgi:hypothetical protein